MRNVCSISAWPYVSCQDRNSSVAATSLVRQSVNWAIRGSSWLAIRIQAEVPRYAYFQDSTPTAGEMPAGSDFSPNAENELHAVRAGGLPALRAMRAVR